jgi:hypothetical protein
VKIVELTISQHTVSGERIVESQQFVDFGKQLGSLVLVNVDHSQQTSETLNRPLSLFDCVDEFIHGLGRINYLLLTIDSLRICFLRRIEGLNQLLYLLEGNSRLNIEIQHSLEQTLPRGSYGWMVELKPSLRFSLK